jgi:hypothetical protein
MRRRKRPVAFDPKDIGSGRQYHRRHNRAEQAEHNVGGLGFRLTTEHPMDYTQAAAAALPVSQPGVGIRAMPMSLCQLRRRSACER